MDLNSLIVEPTAKTPLIDMNPLTGELIISGRSIPENAAKVYESINNWVAEYVKIARRTTNLRLNLEYFNTASSIWLARIVKTLCGINDPESTLIIHTYFEIEEFDNLDSENLRDTLGPIIDMIGNTVISVGLKIYGTDEKGEVIKESMILI
jgi:hypothetical protein